MTRSRSDFGGSTRLCGEVRAFHSLLSTLVSNPQDPPGETALAEDSSGDDGEPRRGPTSRAGRLVRIVRDSLLSRLEWGRYNPLDLDRPSKLTLLPFFLLMIEFAL